MLQANLAQLVKLGSMVRHAEEYWSPTGDEADRDAFESLAQDPDVVRFMQEADTLALLPVKR